MADRHEQDAAGIPGIAGPGVRDWWPGRLRLDVLYRNPPAASPLGESFDYAAAFATIDLEELRRDVVDLMTTSQSWWPADYGHYGPLFIRMAWHSAGTYRVADGRGGAGAGAQRFAPLNSWPDNANLDKARRLLWPIKAKYGQRLSWADLLVFAGNCALESMGLRPFGFGGGREDVFEPEDIYWGPEGEWLADERYRGDRELENPLGAVQMGLIYVNPEGPNGVPDPKAAARDIRETFARMAMDDEETVALIAGGHSFGKTHGAADPSRYVGPEPEAAPLEEMGLGWRNSFASGSGDDTITSGLEGAWTPTPTSWDNSFFEVLYGFEWEAVKSPAGATQWHPAGGAAATAVPDAQDPSRRHPPTMLTTDLALREDPAYDAISRRFLADPVAFEEAFARAWFKLTHRDMGPRARYAGAWVPAEDLIWQDPVPPITHALVGPAELAELTSLIEASGLSVAELVGTAWAAAATFRGTDKRGGANGARIRLDPQNGWEVNEPERLAGVLETLEAIRQRFHAARTDEVAISLADLIVFAGGVGVERAARAAGHEVSVPFTPGRTDATAEMTDGASFAVLEPTADGFRNYARATDAERAEWLLLDRAQKLTLSAPEMTALVGGLRAMGVTYRGDRTGVLTERPGALSHDVFVNLLDMATTWHPIEGQPGYFEGRHRESGEVRWRASRVDLVFGSNSELRAVAEVYGAEDGEGLFVEAFVAAWAKVMELDRFDLR